MHPKVREFVKREVRKRVQEVYMGVSRQGVTVVLLRVKFGKIVYHALGTAKWQKPDEFDFRKGIDLAYNHAIVELVDKIVDPERRNLGVNYILPT